MQVVGHPIVFRAPYSVYVLAVRFTPTTYDVIAASGFTEVTLCDFRIVRGHTADDP